MANKYKLQVPMSEELKIQATKDAKDRGFDSLQAFIRFLLMQVSLGHIEVGGYDPDGGYYIPQKVIDGWNRDFEEWKCEKRKGFSSATEFLKELKKDANRL